MRTEQEVYSKAQQAFGNREGCSIAPPSPSHPIDQVQESMKRLENEISLLEERLDSFLTPTTGNLTAKEVARSSATTSRTRLLFEELTDSLNRSTQRLANFRNRVDL
jgi:hypothetical protein